VPAPSTKTWRRQKTRAAGRSDPLPSRVMPAGSHSADGNLVRSAAEGV
jgi:hypothetical protein